MVHACGRFRVKVRDRVRIIFGDRFQGESSGKGSV